MTANLFAKDDPNSYRPVPNFTFWGTIFHILKFKASVFFRYVIKKGHLTFICKLQFYPKQFQVFLDETSGSFQLSFQTGFVAEVVLVAFADNLYIQINIGNVSVDSARLDSSF